MRRLRQVVIFGDVYSVEASVAYNDAPPMHLATKEDLEQFRKRLTEEGWKKEKGTFAPEDWREEYRLEVEAEAERPGLFALLRRGAERDQVAIDPWFCEPGTGVTGAAASGRTAAVGLQGGRWVAYLFEESELAARVVCVDRQVRPAVAVNEEWWFAGTAGGVQAYHRCAGEWAIHSVFGESNVTAVAAQQGRVAVTHRDSEQVCFYRLREGRWEVEARVAARGNALALSEDVAAVGDPDRFGGTGCVEVFVDRDGQWIREQCLRLTDGRMGDGFGSELWMAGGELHVAGKKESWVYGRGLPVKESNDSLET